MLVWAGVLTEGMLSVTANIEIRYRRPVDVGEMVTVSARLDQRSGRRLRMSGTLSVADEPRVEASGLYLATTPVAELLAGHP
jgi:acyl-CoA thioesterase FadM